MSFSADGLSVSGFGAAQKSRSQEDALGAARRQADWERQIASIDQKEMEIHQTQLRLLREQGRSEPERREPGVQKWIFWGPPARRSRASRSASKLSWILPALAARQSRVAMPRFVLLFCGLAVARGCGWKAARDFAAEVGSGVPTYFGFSLSNSSAVIHPQRTMQAAPRASTVRLCSDLPQAGDAERLRCANASALERMMQEVGEGQRAVLAVGPAGAVALSSLESLECQGAVQQMCHATAGDNSLHVCHEPSGSVLYQATAQNRTFPVACHAHGDGTAFCHALRFLDVAFLAAAPDAQKACGEAPTGRAGTSALRGGGSR